jgi:Xaa-Pro aminopeptidase
MVTESRLMKRTARARDLMRHQGIDCLYLIPGRNQCYFSGYTGWGGWPTRLGAYILPLEEDPVRVTIPMYQGFLNGLQHHVLGHILYLYTDGDQAMARKQVKQALHDLKIETGSIGVEEEIRHTDYQLLKTAVPDASILTVSQSILDPIRMIKDDEEIANIRKSANICDQFFGTAREIIHDGVALNDVRIMLAERIAELGADSSRIPSLTSSSQRVRKGDIFDFEPDVVVNGYYAEASRSFFVGAPSTKEQIIWKTCLKTYSEIEAEVRPGVTMHELDLLYKKLMHDGLREINPQYATSRRLGHGVGLTGGHEIPLVQENNMMKAQPGMVMALDAGPGPGVIQKQDKSGFGHGSVASGITSTVVVTQSGCERLDKFTHGLVIL